VQRGQEYNYSRKKICRNSHFFEQNVSNQCKCNYLGENSKRRNYAISWRGEGDEGIKAAARNIKAEFKGIVHPEKRRVESDTNRAVSSPLCKIADVFIGKFNVALKI
jgi:hypothetical protein